jgi:hypothetical protein
MKDKAETYRSYLLRVWRNDNDGRPVWRFSLESTGGDPPVIFGTPDELLAFLVYLYGPQMSAASE